MQQDGNGVEHAVYFASRTLNESELKYGAMEKEILALIYANKKLHHYLLPKPFTIFSNYNPLRYLLSKPDIKGLTRRWILLLQEYDFEVITRPRAELRVAQGLTQTELPEGRNDHVDILDLQLLAIDVVLAWAQEVVQFLQDQTYPVHFSKEQRRKLCIQAAKYVILGGALYRRHLDGILLRCLSEDEVNDVLHSCHSGLFGGHFVVDVTALRILRCGYYWPTLF
eukprot:Gb_19860 [translate_table: standard]